VDALGSQQMRFVELIIAGLFDTLEETLPRVMEA